MKKECNYCKIVKHIQDFYKHPTGKDGYSSRCKECIKKIRKEYMKTDKYREYRIRYEGKRKDSQKRKLQRKKAWKREFTIHHNKVMARAAVARALRMGYLKKERCGVCGNLKTEAHHPDYKNKLDIIWLCKTHHSEAHKL